MADLTNPSDAYGRASQMMSFLGSYWNTLYAGNQLIYDYVIGKNTAELQAFQNLLETVNSVSRFKIPLFHTENWTLLLINKSDQVNGNVLKYGSTGVDYSVGPSDGFDYVYGGIVGTTTNFPSLANLVDAPIITNSITNPSVLLTKDIDFIIDTSVSVIQFSNNPFNNPAIRSKPLLDAQGNQVDTQIALWIFKGQFDLEYAYKQFGYVLGIYLKSSQNYLDLINAVWDCMIKGSVFASLDRLLALSADSPVSITDQEVVVDIYKETDRTLILTDKNVYVAGLDANVAVTIGQVLPLGTQITDAIKIYYPYRDTVPSSAVPSIALDNTTLVGSFTDSLIFNNISTPLQVSTDANGRTMVQFQLGGSQQDINLFWNTIQTNGTATGAISLAQLLDLRYPPAHSPDPTAVNLPTTINPVTFLLQNVIRNNALVVVMNAGSFGPNAVATSITKAFKQVIPPSTALFIFAWVSVSDTIAMTGVGTFTSAGYSESINSAAFTAPDPFSEANLYPYIGPEVIHSSII